MAGCKCGGMMAYLGRGFSTGAFWASALPIRPGQVSRHSKVIKGREAQFLLVIRVTFLLGNFVPTDHCTWRREETLLGFGQKDPRSPLRTMQTLLILSRPSVNVQKF